MVEEVLYAVSRAGYRSVLFPALGTGNLGHDCHSVAAMFRRVMDKFNCLQSVSIVVYDKDNDAIEAFKNYFQEGSYARPKDEEKKEEQKERTSRASQSSNKKVPSVSLEIFGFNAKSVNEAMKKVKHLVDEHISEDSIVISALSDLAPVETLEITKSAHELNVDIEINGKGEFFSLGFWLGTCSIDLTKRWLVAFSCSYCWTRQTLSSDSHLNKARTFLILYTVVMSRGAFGKMFLNLVGPAPPQIILH